MPPKIGIKAASALGYKSIGIGNTKPQTYFQKSNVKIKLGGPCEVVKKYFTP
jgi:hypothetical protein